MDKPLIGLLLALTVIFFLLFVLKPCECETTHTIEQRAIYVNLTEDYSTEQCINSILKEKENLRVLEEGLNMSE